MFKGLTFWRVLIIISVVISLAAFIVEWQRGLVLEYFRQGRPFDRFAIFLMAIVILPRLFERVGLPGMLGLILGGLLLGPNGLALASKIGEVGHFFSEMGRVFLMFIAGLEISLSDFRRYAKPSSLFGVATFAGPMIGGFVLGQAFGYSTNASVLIGSLLASHTLLGYPILEKLGLVRAPFVLTTIGATIFTDIASLLVLAVCLSVHVSGILSWYTLAELIGALAVYCVKSSSRRRDKLPTNIAPELGFRRKPPSIRSILPGVHSPVIALRDNLTPACGSGMRRSQC